MHFISFTIKLSILLLLLLCVFAIPISKFSLNNYTDYTSIFLTMCTNRLQVVFFLVASGDEPTNNNIPTHLWLQEILNVSTFRGFCRCYLIWWTPWWRRWLPWVTWQTWTIYFKNHFPCFFPTKNTPWIFQQKKKHGPPKRNVQKGRGSPRSWDGVSHRRFITNLGSQLRGLGVKRWWIS